MGDLQSSAERYVKDAFQWLVPFLHRCEGQTAGAAVALLREYLVGLAQQDLTLALVVFRQSKPDVRGNDADARTHARTIGHAYNARTHSQMGTHTRMNTLTRTQTHKKRHTQK